MGKPTFKTVYEDPKRGLRRDPRALADATGRSVEDARAYLASTAAAQAQKAWRRPALSAYSTTGGPIGEYQADVVYFAEFAGVNHQAMAILTLLEATTRFVYARTLTNDSAKTTAAALDSIIERNMEDDAPIINSVVIDGGGEFKGVTRRLLDSKHIRVNQVAPRTHQRLARVDRFHRTLRQLIGRLMGVRKNYLWADKLQDVIQGYNDAPHSSLGGRSPAEINVSPKRIRKLQKGDRRQARKVRHAVTARAAREDIEPGAWVRVVLNRLRRLQEGPESHVVRARADRAPPTQQRVGDRRRRQPERLPHVHAAAHGDATTSARAACQISCASHDSDPTPTRHDRS
jgi:hypothetical protein